MHAYGQLGIVQSTLTLWQASIGLGLGITATKFVAELRQRDATRAARILSLTQVSALAIGIVSASIVVGFSTSIADSLLATSVVAAPLRVGAPLIIFGVVAAAQTGALAGFEAFRAIAWISVISAIASFPLMLAGARLFGVEGAIGGNVFAMVLTCWLNARILRQICSEQLSPRRLGHLRDEVSVLWRFTLPATLTAMLVGPVTWAANALLVNTGNGYAQMGVFSAANQWRVAAQFIPTAIGTALLPVLTSFVASGRWNEVSRVLRTNVLLVFAISIVVAAPVILLSKYLMLGYGEEFGKEYAVLIVLMAATVLSSGPVVIGQAITSLDKMWLSTCLNAIWAISLLTTFLLFRTRGALGLSYAYFISYCIHFISAGLVAYGLIRRHHRSR